MAENKRSFIAYVDWKETFDSLPDEKAGQLIKHLFAYVNDENPNSDDILINAVFANIKHTLKRDLIKYKCTIKKRAESGKLGGIKSGESRKTKQMKQMLQKRSKTKQNEANEADSVNDSVSVSVNDNVNDKEKKKRKIDFDFHFVDAKFIPVFMEWIDYKKSRNENYKTQKSLEACYRNLLRLSQDNPGKAKTIIDQAMGNNWAGIFPLKTETQNFKQELAEEIITHAELLDKFNKGDLTVWERYEQAGKVNGKITWKLKH